jgi:hypothetical protein
MEGIIAARVLENVCSDMASEMSPKKLGKIEKRWPRDAIKSA